VTYPEIFPVGTRVKVRAGYGEGTDQEWAGHDGTVVKWHGCGSASIAMDKAKRNWPRGPIIITAHNLRYTREVEGQ
jgi:hypothetical protein